VERQEEILRLFRDAIAGGFLGERSRDAARASTRRAHRELASEARRAMGERLDERLTLESLARAVHSSPYHLSRVFRAETGWSVHGYLTQLRLAAGLDRLERGRPLSLAALEVGFSSHSHFTAMFRRSFGVTPSAWRDEGSKRAGS
jgi:AraC-like DNA-binding protein